MTGPRGRGRGRGGGAGGRARKDAFTDDGAEVAAAEPEMDPDLARIMNAANRVRIDMNETTGRFQARSEFLPTQPCVYGLMRENTKKFMQLPDHLIGCMGATGKGFVTVKNSYMNTEKICRDSSPGIHFVQEMLSPHPPRCLKVFTYFGNCINSMDNLNGCVVPTPFTELLVQNKKVIGINHVSEEGSKEHRTRSQMTLQELMRFQVAVETEDLMTVKNKENPVEVICRMVPAQYQDNNGKNHYRLFMVCSLVGRSGVDVLACIRKITDPLVCSTVIDKELALSRRVQWNAIWLEELHICEKDVDVGGSMCINANIDFDNEQDPQHPLLYCGEHMILAKINAIILLEQEKVFALNPEIRFSNYEVFGMPQPRDDEQMLAYQLFCQKYCERIREHRLDFRKSSEHFYFGLKSGNIPDVKYNLRHVYGLVLSTVDYDYITDYSFGYMEAPMTMIWRPLNPLNSHESWEKFDTGQLPLTARILTLDFQQGAIEMNESVLSDNDKQPAMEILRWNLYYCAMRDPLLEYVRPNCYKVWKQGIMHKLVSMMDDAKGQVCMDDLGHIQDDDERKLMYGTCRKVVERARMYITQAARWHLAQIEVGEYRSDCLQCGAVVLKAYRNDLPALMKKVWKKHGESAPDSNLFSLSMQMRQTFYRCCLAVNKYASMSYANMEIFTQVFTTDMLWHFGHNESWTTFCQCIQVVTLKGGFEHSVQRNKNGGGTARYITKCNSSGVDAIVSWWYNNMMRLPESTVPGLDDCTFTMVGTHRQTPVAMERQSKIRIVGDRIQGEPSAHSRFRMQKMTEERHLKEAELAAKIRSLPRHKNANDDASMHTTDYDETGRRQAERWVDIGGYFLGLCATNARVACEEEAESVNTLSQSQLWMSTGRYGSNKRSYADIEDHQVIASTKTTAAITDDDFKKELVVPMCVIPKVTAQIVALMNQFGLIAVEIDAMARELDSWFCMMYMEFFGSFNHKLVLSVRRRLDGMQARTVAEASMSRLMLELSLSDTFDEALQSTCLTLSYHALNPIDVCVYIDDGIRQCVDQVFILMHKIIATDILGFPTVDFDWLCRILRRGHATPQERASANGVLLTEFLRRCAGDDHFLFADDSNAVPVMDFTNPNNGVPAFQPPVGKRVPYVCCKGNGTGGMLNIGDEYLRVCSKSSSSTAHIISQTLRKCPEIKNLHSVSGLPLANDVDMMALALLEYAGRHLDLSAYICATGSLNPARLYSCFGLDRLMPASFNEVSYNVNSATMGFFSSTSSPVPEFRNAAFGVHIVAGLLVTALHGTEMVSNSSCDSVLSENIMCKILRLAPRALLAPTGSAFLRKSFSGGVVQYDTLHLPDDVETVHGVGKTDYFTRPLHDDGMVKDGSPQYMSCTIYKGYCPEDLLHMTHVIAAMKYFRVPHIGMLPLDLVRPRYNMLYDVFYPIVRLRDTHYQEGGINTDAALHGYIRTYIDKDGLPVFQAFASYYDDQYMTIPGVAPAIDCFVNGDYFHVAEMDKGLGDLQLLVAPLIRRHSAVVYRHDSKKFGVIVPRMEADDTTWMLDDRDDSVYFDPDAMCYYTVFVGDTCSTTLHPLQVETCLLGLGTKVYIRSSLISRYATATEISVSLSDSPVEYVVAHIRYAQNTPDTFAGFCSITVCVQKVTAHVNEVDMLSVTIPVTEHLSESDFLLASTVVDTSAFKIIGRI